MARRWIAGLALIVVVLNGGGASASPQPSPAPFLVAAGTTVLKGDTSATLDLYVPKDAVLDLTPVERNGMLEPKGMRVVGGRHYVGFLLTERATSTGMFAVGARLPRPLTDGDSVHRAVGYGQPAAADRSASPLDALPGSDPQPATCVRCVVAAGHYRLQLLTLGKPATVSITFEGLRNSTTLRPTAETDPFGFSGSFRPMGGQTSLSDGGGMGMGMAWSRRESGVLLSTYQLDVTPDELPVAAADVSTCRTAGKTEHCSNGRISAGTAPSMAGFGATGADRIKDVSSSMSFSTMGYAKWVARTSVLWIPTGGRNDAIAVAAQPDAGTQLITSRVFR